MNFKAIFFDLGDTIIEQRHDSEVPLDRMRLKLIPGAKWAIEKLVQEYRLGMISNTTQSTGMHVKRALRQLEMPDCFHAIITSTDIGCKKPARGIFEAALGALGVSAGESLMIGNSLEEDILGAKALGISGGLFNRNSVGGKTFGADFVFTSMFLLPGCISGLEDVRSDLPRP